MPATGSWNPAGRRVEPPGGIPSFGRGQSVLRRPRVGASPGEGDGATSTGFRPVAGRSAQRPSRTAHDHETGCLGRLNTAGCWRRQALPSIRPFEEVESVGNVRDVDVHAQRMSPRHEGRRGRLCACGPSDQFVDGVADASAAFISNRLHDLGGVALELDSGPHDCNGTGARR